jgi:hypothetical protein
MDQTYSISKTGQTLSMLEASFMDKNSELALAITCKALYKYYERYYEDKTAVILCNPQDKLYYHNDDIKAHQLRDD